MKNLMEMIQENAGVNEESMALGKPENQTNAIRTVQEVWAKYVKNNKIVEAPGFDVGKLRVASKLLADLNNPKLAKYEKMAAKVIGLYDMYRKKNVSASQVK
jgi:hypothetical protein